MPRGHDQRENWQTGAAGHSDRRRKPDNGGGGQATHTVAAYEDESAADETDTRYDLRGDSRRVQNDSIIDENVVEAVLQNQHDERRRETNQRVSSQAGAFMADFALQANEGGQHESQAKLAKLQPALTGEFSNQHSRLAKLNFGARRDYTICIRRLAGGDTNVAMPVRLADRSGEASLTRELPPARAVASRRRQNCQDRATVRKLCEPPAIPRQ